MPKNMMPMAPSGRGLLSKVVGTLVLVAVVMLVVKYPADAAHMGLGAWHLLTTVVSGLVTFFRQIGG